MSNPYEALKPVKSSMFTRAGYVDATWELLLELSSTKEIRSYSNVSPESAEEALTAESIGKWWNANVRGNPQWQYETLGSDPSITPPVLAPTPPASSDLGISEADIQQVDPGYRVNDQTTIRFDKASAGSTDRSVATNITQVQSGKIVHGETGTRLEPFGLDDVFNGPVTVTAPKMMHVSEVADWPKDGSLDALFPASVFAGKPKDEFDGPMRTPAQYQDYPVTDGEAFQSKDADLSTIIRPEIMPAWTKPESPAEALDMLTDRETEISALIEQNKQIGAQAMTVRVTNAAMRLASATTLTELVEKKDKTTEMLDPLREQLYEAYKYAGARLRDGVGPIDAAITHIKGQMTTWDREQERLRQEQIRREREKAEAEARERQRKEQEALTMAEVSDALEAGDTAQAEHLMENPIEVPLPFVAPAYVPSVAPVIEGQSTSKKWKVREDLIETEEAYLASVMTMLRAVKEDKIDLRLAASYLKWDMVSLNKLAGALKSAFFVPGLTADEVSNISVRRKK